MNILEYLKNNSEREITSYNLCPADILVFSMLSYINFSNVVPRGFEKKVTLRVALDQMFAFSPGKIKKYNFLKTLRETNRYSNLELCGYRSEIGNSSEVKQFAAITITIPKSKIGIVSYSGTDGTVVGWKEDFQFAYLSSTIAQNMALDYLEEVLCELSENFIVTGHSKGGNLALYSSIFTSRENQDRIDSIFCNDGPGFNEKLNIRTQTGFLHVHKKITCIQPQDSIVGQLLEIGPGVNKIVIKSDAERIIYQHDLMTWQVNQYGFLMTLSHLNSTTVLFMDKVNELIGTLSMTQRKGVVDKLFQILDNNNINYVNGIKLKNIIHK